MPVLTFLVWLYLASYNTCPTLILYVNVLLKDFLLMFPVIIVNDYVEIWKKMKTQNYVGKIIGFSEWETEFIKRETRAPVNLTGNTLYTI